MRHAGDQAAERRQLLGGDQVLLGFAQVVERLFGALLRGAQLVLGLALGDGVLAKHRDRPRHLADLVAGLRVRGSARRISPRRRRASPP